MLVWSYHIFYIYFLYAIYEFQFIIFLWIHGISKIRYLIHCYVNAKIVEVYDELKNVNSMEKQ